jgi:hypothetical protein
MSCVGSTLAKMATMAKIIMLMNVMNMMNVRVLSFSGTPSAHR